MDASRAKRRGNGLVKLLSQGKRRGCFFISHAIKTVAHADVEFARARDFQTQVMKGTLAGPLVECRFIRSLSDQIETFLIFQYPSNPAAQIVRIPNGDAAGLVRENVQALLIVVRLITPGIKGIL